MVIYLCIFVKSIRTNKNFKPLNYSIMKNFISRAVNNEFTATDMLLIFCVSFIAGLVITHFTAYKVI